MTAQPMFPNSHQRAVFSDCARYRYALWREWRDTPVLRCLFVMLNPSTANDEKDDPTIKRCIKFAQRWGFDALDVANMFAFRSPHPDDLWREIDPVGELNDEWILKLAKRSARIVVAWGNHGNCDREDAVLELLKDFPLMCLGLTDHGMPTHPLARGRHWVPDDVEVVEWARGIRDQCKAADVAFFLKQLGAEPFDSSRGLVCGFEPGDPEPDTWLSLNDRAGGEMDEWPDDLKVREFPEVRHA